MKLIHVAASAALLATHTAGATFVNFVQTVTQVSTGGVLLDRCRIYARFDGTTDTLLNAFNLSYTGGATVADPHGAFYHKDQWSSNSGVLSRQFGTWLASRTGSATLNRPYDSYLTIGGDATPTNTSGCDPAWTSGGSGIHAGDSRADGRPDLPNNGTIGWFNSNPPNQQGRAGVAPNTATDVLIAQFVIDRGAFVGTWSLTLGYNNGTAGSVVSYGTASFSIGSIPVPGTAALFGISGLMRRRRSR